MTKLIGRQFLQHNYQVPQEQEWRTNSDDVCLATTQRRCHGIVNSGWFLQHSTL